MKILRQKEFARKKGKKAEDYLREAVEEAKENLKRDPNNWKYKYEYKSLTEPIGRKRANISQEYAIRKKRLNERGGISFHNQDKFDSTGHIVGKGKQIRWNERDPLDKKGLDSIDNLIRYEHSRDKDSIAKVKEINEKRKDELRSRLSSKSLKEVETRKKLADKAKKLQKAKKAALIGVPVAAAAIGTGVAIKKHHDKKKKEQE